MSFLSGREQHVFAVSLGARLLMFILLVVFFSGFTPLSTFGDGINYLEHARGLVEEHAYMNPASPSGLSASRPPGYAAFLAFFMFLGLPLWLAGLVQVCIVSYAPVLLMRIAHLAGFHVDVSSAAGYLMAVEPLTVFFAVPLVSDSLGAFLFLAAAYLLLLFYHSHRTALLLGSAVLVGVMNYIRPIGLYLYLVIPSVLLVSDFFFRRAEWGKRSIRQALLFGLISYAMLAPWMLRNYYQFGFFSFVSAAERQVFEYTATAIEADVAHVPFAKMHTTMVETVRPILPVSDPYHFDSFKNLDLLGTRAFEIIRAHPWVYFKLYVISLQTFFTGGGYHATLQTLGILRSPSCPIASVSGAFLQENIQHTLTRLRCIITKPSGLVALLGKSIWASMFLIALYGMLRAWREYPASRPLILFLLSMGVYLSLVIAHLTIGIEARHRLLLHPFYFLFTAFVYRRWKTSHHLHVT